MATVDLTIRVHGLPCNVKEADLITFFSYCGTIDKIELPKNKNDPARVTFKQPYAQQTALLLNNATISDCQVHILPDKYVNDEAQEETQCAAKPDSVWSRGCQMLRRADGAIGNVGSVYLKEGALWLSGVFDKASKHTAQLAINISKEAHRETNSRKK